jgi:hypothetical protein
MSFIPGDCVHLKVSGELVCILAHRSGANEYDVRRCVRRKLKGHTYIAETYFGFELEDQESFLLKRKSEMDELAKAMLQGGVAIVDDRPRGPSQPPHSHDNKKPN